MQITKVLENEVGVQFDRVKDNTGSTGTALINGVITGSFKRGRTDKQMQVTQSNIKAVLGYDPDNPDYVAVQDALNTGVPYVNVMRVVADNCKQLPSFLEKSLGNAFRDLTNKPYVLTINGVAYPDDNNATTYFGAVLSYSELSILSIYADSSNVLHLQNKSNDCLHVTDTEGLDVMLGINSNA